MIPEKEPRQIVENALVIEVGDKRILYSRQDWYTNKDITHAVRRNSQLVNGQLHRIREKDKSIEFTTLGELNRKDNLALTGRPQTILCNEENFIKAIIAVASIETRPLPSIIRSEPNKHKSPPSKEKRPKKPEETHRTPSKEALNIKHPKQILAANSVVKALSLLANGTLEKDIPNNIKEFLEQVAIEHVQLPRFEDDPKENILKKILDSDSESRLNRFFTVTLDGMLYDLWDVIDANERRLKEEKEIIETCKKLKRKGYDKKGVIQELFTHFRIPVPESIWL